MLDREALQNRHERKQTQNKKISFKNLIYRNLSLPYFILSFSSNDIYNFSRYNSKEPHFYITFIAPDTKLLNQCQCFNKVYRFESRRFSGFHRAMENPTINTFLWQRLSNYLQIIGYQKSCILK